MSILLAAILFIVIIGLTIFLDIWLFARVDRKELNKELTDKQNADNQSVQDKQNGNVEKQKELAMNPAEKDQTNEKSMDNQPKEKKQRLVYLPNLKIWAFGAVAGLAIFLIPLIYKVMDIIFNTGWHRPFPRFYHRFTAWPHYLTQIFGLLFILGIIGIFAYTLVKISKDD
jgi:uncharacterized membrane protein